MLFGLSLVLFECGLEVLRLRGLGHLGQRVQDFLLGEVDVLQRFVKQFLQVLFGHNGSLLGLEWLDLELLKNRLQEKSFLGVRQSPEVTEWKPVVSCSHASAPIQLYLLRPAVYLSGFSRQPGWLTDPPRRLEGDSLF